MYLPTSLPVATECALRRRSDRLLVSCFALSIGVHVALGVGLARLRWSRPEPPAPRVTEVRLLKRLPLAPPVLRDRQASAPRQPVLRPRDLSLYLQAEREAPRRSRRRRSRRPRNTPPAPTLAAMPTPEPAAAGPVGSAGGTLRDGRRGEKAHRTDPSDPSDPSDQTIAVVSPPRLLAPSPPPALPATEEPRPVQVARRGEPVEPPSVPRAEPARAPEPLVAPGRPLAREPVAARGAARPGEGALARLPEMPLGADDLPRVLTGADREAGGVPRPAPMARPGERPRRSRASNAATLPSGRPDAVPAATEPGAADLPDPAAAVAAGADEARVSRGDADAAGRPDGPGDRSEGQLTGRRMASLPPPSGSPDAEPGARSPEPASGVSDDGAPRSLGRGGRRATASDGQETGARGEGQGAREGGSSSPLAPDTSPLPGDVGPGRGEGDGADGGREADGLPGEGGAGAGPGGGGAARGEPGGGLAGKGSPGGVYVSTTGRYLLPGAVTGSNYMFHVNALNRILDEINSRTRLQVQLGRQYLRIRPGGFRRAPVVVFTGHRAFTLNDEQRLALRQYVEGGGMLWADLSGDAFDESFREEMERIFGQRPVAISSGHTLYRSFYVLDGVPAGDLGGRAPFEGITMGDRLAVVLTPNRYFAAVGGPPRVSEAVQEGALRVAVNIYVYAAAQYRAETE